MDNNNEQQALNGVVEDIVYYNNDNGYAVCYVQIDNEYVTVVGYMPCIAEGESITVNGVWTYHPEYGKQFKAEYFEKNMPREKAEILKYLSSGIIKGIRQATAQKIVDFFGDKALDIIAKSPQRLAEINGISANKAIEIGKSYVEQIGVRDVVMFLQKFGISANYAVKVYKRYGSGSVEIIKHNPYILAEEVYGIGFKMADKIAIMAGISSNSAIRIEAAVKYSLWNASTNGHTFLPRDLLIQSTKNIIEVDDGEVDNAISGLLFADKLKNEQYQAFEAIYLTPFYNAENYISKRLRMLNRACEENCDIENIISRVEKEQDITLADMQKEAVSLAIENNAVVITGGPGTGKTTIINSIIKVMEFLDKKIMLAAPTGRAAKRMTEMCGEDAKTIHRLLEATFSDEHEGMHFGRDEKSPLDCDVLIVDEMSMVDTLLMNSLLKAVKDSTKLILVGDSDQLPSVGAGYVLKDIISAGTIATVSLTEIFRQAKESMIVQNAHKINNGSYPVVNEQNTDFFLVQRENAGEIVNSIVDLCINRLPKKYGVNPMAQIQVITPTRKGPSGVNILNEKLQFALNPPTKMKKEKNFKNILFREGDKIMQIKNNYTIEWEKQEDDSSGVGVFNGDVGFIEKINFDKENVKVIFDDRICVYDFSQLDELDLAYAVTVHKSQGSEFDVVVMPMYPVAPLLQSRNLFYTSVTRAKKLVVLVGRSSVIANMVDNVNEQKRYSGLLNKLEG